MGSMIDYLKGLSEETPRWLTSHRTGVKPNLSDFFGSRVVYYPGAGIDGQPVRLFNMTHSAHCFMYVDYLVKEATLSNVLTPMVSEVTKSWALMTILKRNWLQGDGSLMWTLRRRPSVRNVRRILLVCCIS
jgi:hypothetical protein